MLGCDFNSLGGGDNQYSMGIGAEWALTGAPVSVEVEINPFLTNQNQEEALMQEFT